MPGWVKIPVDFFNGKSMPFFKVLLWRCSTYSPSHLRIYKFIPANCPDPFLISTSAQIQKETRSECATIELGHRSPDSRTIGHFRCFRLMTRTRCGLETEMRRNGTPCRKNTTLGTKCQRGNKLKKQLTPTFDPIPKC